MECPACGTENLPGTDLCEDCGSSLINVDEPGNHSSAIAKALEVFPTSQQLQKRPKVYRLGTDASLAKQPGSVLAGTHTDPDKYKRFLEEKRAKKKKTKWTSKWWFWASIGAAVVTTGVVTAMALEPAPEPAKTFTIGATMPKAP